MRNKSLRPHASIALAFALCLPLRGTIASDRSGFARARENGQKFDQMAQASQRLMKAWLKYADPRTSLLLERLPQLKPEDKSRSYTPHNSGADLYPYLILTAHLTDLDLYQGTLLEMLRNEAKVAVRTLGSRTQARSSAARANSLFESGDRRPCQWLERSHQF